MATEKNLFGILMLHGYRQNEKYFYDKTGSLRKALKEHAQLIYCQAPHKIGQITNDVSEISEERIDEEFGWWLKSNVNYLFLLLLYFYPFVNRQLLLFPVKGIFFYHIDKYFFK